MLDWIRTRVLKPALGWLQKFWGRVRGMSLFEVILVSGTAIWVRIMPSGLALGLMAQIAPKVSEDRKHHKQWNLLLGLIWIGVCLVLWYWVRELAMILIMASIVFFWRHLVSYYDANRENWKPGSAFLWTLWDLFGEFGDSVTGLLRKRFQESVERRAPAQPWVSRRTWFRTLKPVNPLKRLWRRIVRRWANRFYPMSSNDPKAYDLSPFGGREITHYWVEEHRNPNKSFAGTQDEKLTPEQARELKKGIKGPNGKLYRKGTEVIDPETGYAVDGETIGTWHHDVTIQYPDGRYLRWAAVPPKPKSGESGVKPGMGKFDVFPGYLPDEDGNAVSQSTTWILQPEHFKPTNPDVIESGYGKGTCKVVVSGRCEVWLGHKYQTASGRTVRYLHFNPEGIDGKYAVIHDPENDHHIVVRMKPRPIPRGGKIRMKEVRPGTPEAEALFQDPNYLAQAKKDGASSWIKVGVDAKGETPATRLSLGSWRESARLLSEYGVNEPIDYTDKLSHIRDEAINIPPGEVDFEGRVEVWCGTPNGDRNLQQKLQWDDIKAGRHPSKPYIYVVDVTKWKGKDITHLPYQERLKLIQELNSKSPIFKVPPTASTEKGKRNLWDAGRDEAWVDGIVFKHKTDPDASSIKLKYRWENPRTAVVLGVNEGDGKYKGTTGSLRCMDTELGVEFNIAGEGLTDEVRGKVWKNRNKMVGKEVQYYSCPDRAKYHGEVFQPTLAEFEM